MHEYLESPSAPCKMGLIQFYICMQLIAYFCLFCLTSFGNAFMKISSAVHQLFPNFPGGSASLAAMFDRSQYQFPSSHV